MRAFYDITPQFWKKGWYFRKKSGHATATSAFSLDCLCPC